MLMQIPRTLKYQHDTGYCSINFNLDRIVMLLRNAPCIGQTAHLLLCSMLCCYNGCLT